MGTTWSKFFWADWLSDPALTMCSLGAQGLWMRMLCICAEASPVGYLKIAGRALDISDIEKLGSVSSDEAASLVAELERNHVFSRNRAGEIYSRRLIRDEKKARTARKNGKVGGNPSLRNAKGKSASVNPPLRPPDNPLSGAHAPATHLPSATSHMPIANSQAAELSLEDLERVLRKAAGWENHPAPTLLVLGPIIALVQAGLNLELDIVPVIKAKAAKCRNPNWGFFVDAIRDAHQARISAGRPINGNGRSSQVDWTTFTRRDYENAVDIAKSRDEWFPAYGPPDRIPPDLMDGDLRRIVGRARH